MKICKQNSYCVLYVGNKKFVLASVLRETLYFLIRYINHKTPYPC